MSFSDKFAESEYAGRGYDEIAKAVFQIWRFVAHCRLRQTQHEVPTGAVGVVILLDSWMTMVLDARQEVLKRAEARCCSEPAISTADKIDIAFVGATHFPPPLARGWIVFGGMSSRSFAALHSGLLLAKAFGVNPSHLRC